MITYRGITSRVTDVFIDRKKSGQIRLTGSGYCYFPNGQKRGGEFYESIAECMESLEPPKNETIPSEK